MSGYHSGTYTPIRPAAPASPAGSGPPDPNEPGPVSSRRSLPRRQVTPVACNQCKKRKSKCDGVRPICTTCQVKQTECVFDASNDQRRTAALKEKLGGLKDENTALRTLLEMMNTVEAQQKYGPLVDRLIQSQYPAAETAHAIDIIRNGLDPEEYAMEPQAGDATGTGGGMEGIEQSSAQQHPWQHMHTATGASPSSYGQEPTVTRGEGPYGEGPSNTQRGPSSDEYGQQQQYAPSSSGHNG